MATPRGSWYGVHVQVECKFAEFVLKEAYWGTVKEPVLPAMFTSVRVARNIRKHSGGHEGKDFQVLGISFCIIELWGVLSDERGVSGVFWFWGLRCKPVGMKSNDENYDNKNFPRVCGCGYTHGRHAAGHPITWMAMEHVLSTKAWGQE
ncbi:hypothetical protein I7I51_03692 [Histoplasma capsulatum]|uniref:Uncharacterized protein n=1 Tax=Ajellomyces capsulatus TaxID=5037 RepID=A0A8A1MBI4_AJECA|nr:predicted protein [Histoplasma mississippiense (nom. inval.)]EDN07043.1 predicted protein [Histoplasma mississippiense (nom. inval.)]QSS61517.1 hypothetical protein I7I51_03692 [Histoplasma capsulatum]